MTSELETAGLTPISLEDAAQNPDAPQADLRDLGSLMAALDSVRPNAVIHLAAISFVAHSKTQDFWDVNVEGSQNLLRAIHETNCQPDIVIMASSANVYGNSTAGALSEDEPPRPANPYAESKLAMEQMAAEWMDTLPITLTRPFNYTGIGQAEHFLVPKIVGHFKTEAAKIELGNLDVSRDFSDVRDIAKMYARLLEEKPAGTTVNLCSGYGTSLEEILTLATSISNHELEVTVNPDFVRQNEIKSLIGNPELLHSVIGRTVGFSMEDTVRWMLGKTG